MAFLVRQAGGRLEKSLLDSPQVLTVTISLDVIEDVHQHGMFQLLKSRMSCSDSAVASFNAVPQNSILVLNTVLTHCEFLTLGVSAMESFLCNLANHATISLPLLGA